MPRRCSVTGCRSNYRDKSSVGKYVSCYGFPSDGKTLKKWLDAIGRRNFVPNYDNAVCAKHFDVTSFVSEDMYRGADGELKVFKFAKPKLKNEAVPSLFLERSLEGERTDPVGFGANEETMPLSPLIDGLHHKTGAVLHKGKVLEVDEGKTCMDFVEVEMKDAKDEEKPLNLGERFCGSLDLRTTNRGSSEGNGCLANETIRDGDCLKNCGDTSRRNLVSKRGLEKHHCDSAVNCKLVHHQLVRGKSDADSGRFLKKAKGCGALSSQNQPHQSADAADAKLDGDGTVGISTDDGPPRQGTDGNCAGEILGNRSEGEHDATSIKEIKGTSGEDVGNLVIMSGHRSDSDETNDQVRAVPEENVSCEDLGSEKKTTKIVTNCGGTISRVGDSSGSFLGEIGGGKNSEDKNATQGEENGSFEKMEVNLIQNHLCEYNHDSEAKISTGKSRGAVRNIKKIQKDCGCYGGKDPKKGAILKQGSGNLVLHGNYIQCGSAMMNGQGIGRNRGFVKNKKNIQSCAHSGCKNGSVGGNFGAVTENESGAIAGEENYKLVLLDGNLSPSDGMESGQLVSAKNLKRIECSGSGFGVSGQENGNLVLIDADSGANDDIKSGQVLSKKNLKKSLRDFGDTRSNNECLGIGFGALSQNESRAIPGQESGSLVSMDANSCPNNDAQSGQVVFAKNLKKLRRNFGDTRPGSSSGGATKSEIKVIPGLEKGINLVMEANSGPHDDINSAQAVSVKNLQKPQRDYGDTRSNNGFGTVTKNERKVVPGQENGILVLMEANSGPIDDVQSEQAVSVKNLKKTQRDFGDARPGSGFGAVTKNEKRAFPGQENGILVLMDANSSPIDDIQSERVVSVKNSKKTQRDFDARLSSGFSVLSKNEIREIPGQENGNLVLMDANLGGNDVQCGQVAFAKNPKRDFDARSSSGFCAVAKNERRAIAGQENGDLVLIDANSSPIDDIQPEPVVSVKNSKKTQRDFDARLSSGFNVLSKNEIRVIPGQENGNLVLMDANLGPNDVQCRQVAFAKNAKNPKRDFDARSSSGFCAVAKNERRAIAGQENGDLVLMDANLGGNDVQCGQVAFAKNAKTPQRDFDGRSSSGFCAVAKNERRAIAGQENGDLVLIDANSSPIDDIQPEPVVSVKNSKKTQRDFDARLSSGFNVLSKNERRAIAGQENGDLVLIDANLMGGDGMEESVGEVKVGGQIRGYEKTGEDEGPSEVQEWEGWAVKEELFRGLGLVPRGVLHGRSVDRRHCVTGSRRSESGKPKTAVFYPPGTAMFDTERFIGEIQRRPAIYDVRSKVYSNRVAKLKYWHEVGQEMYKGWDALDQMERRTLVKELQIKWKSIRDHFMRQLKQNMNGEGPKKKKYVHFDQLQFLTANLGVKRPRHSFKAPKQEPEEEYMELTPELPEERHFSFMTSVGRPDYDEHEVPVAAALLPQQPEDLSYHHHPKDLSYHHHKELSYHKELEGDRMGNKMFLLSLLPIMERLPDHSNIRARLQLMEVLQTFVAHEDAAHRDYYSYHDEKQSCGDVSQQHSTASHSDSDT